MIVIPDHAREQIESRGITREEIEYCIEFGEIAFEEDDPRFGRKYASKLRYKMQDLFVIWKKDNGSKTVITAYWRKRR